MKIAYTEKILKSMNKVQLLEITVANGIIANEEMSNNDIRALILEKGCFLPENDVEIKYSKDQILKSACYSNRRDILNTLLEDEKQYSHAMVQKLLDEFMKGKVN